MKRPENMTTEELTPYVAEYGRRMRGKYVARHKVLRPCPKCGKEFGARELRKHKPTCKEEK